MADNVSDLVLNGNTAARLPLHIFVSDNTVAKIRCEACDWTSGAGSLALYAAPMGAVLKCADCESVLMRRLPRYPRRHGRAGQHTSIGR
jgi:hypothetical protein